MPSARVLPRRRVPAWAATAVLVAVSVLQLVAASARPLDRDPLALVSAALGAAGLLAAVRYLTARCFESRLAMVLLASGSVVAGILAHTIGAPGASAVQWTTRDVIIVVLAAALAVLAWPATAVTADEASCRS